MIQIEKKYTINLPLEQTFSFITNPSNDCKWMSSCLGVEIKTEDTYDVIFKFFGKKLKFSAKSSASAFSTYTYETTSGPLFYKGSYQFQPSENGTLIQWNFTADPGKFFGLVSSGILRKALDKQADTDIKNLMELIKSFQRNALN